MSAAERRHQVAVSPLAEKVKLKNGTMAKVDVSLEPETPKNSRET